MTNIERTRKYIGKQEWTYERLRPYLMTGDVVLCNGRGLLSDLIGWLTGSDKSHIGLIVRTSYEVQLLHSGYTKFVHGVQLTPFGEYVRNYKGEVFVRFLHCERTREWFETLHKFIDEHRGTSYEKGLGGILELLGAVLRINRPDDKEFFCSEMVAEIFKRWGFLPPQMAANNYRPSDFEEGKKVDVILGAYGPDYGKTRLGPGQKVIE